MNFLDAMIAAKNGDSVQRAPWVAGMARVCYNNGDLVWMSKSHPEQHYHPMCDDIFSQDWNLI